jgi:hypothetical protein
VGVAENPRSGVGARGSSGKKGRINDKSCYALPSIALPLLNLLTLEILAAKKVNAPALVSRRALVTIVSVYSILVEISRPRFSGPFKTNSED